MSHSVLIVDDEEFIRSSIRRTLRKEQYDLVFAANPFEAFRILADRPIDLVISDHLMPRMTGIEFLGHVAGRWPDTMRIVLTGQSDVEMAIRAINEGSVYRFLTKPWDEKDLITALRLALAALDTRRETDRLLAGVVRPSEATLALETSHPGITEVQRDDRGAILLEA